VGARVLSNAVQITHRYIEEFQATGDKEEATRKTIRAMTIPNAAAVATDAAGFLVLILAKIVLMQHIAIMMSFWMVTIVLEGILVPIICSYLPLSREKSYGSHEGKEGWLARLNMGLARFSVTSGRYVVGGTVLAILILGVRQTSQLKIGDPTEGSPLLWPDHPFNRAVERLNDYFGASSEDLVLYFKGDGKEAVYDPAVFKTFEAFDRHMRVTLPDIYKSSDSFINIMSAINIMFRYGDVIYGRLPSSQEEMNVLIGFSKENVQVATQKLYFDRDMKMTRLSVFFTDHTSDNLLRIRDAAYEFFREYPMKIDAGTFQLAGGRVGMEIAVNEEMKRSHLLIDAMVLATIFFMCSLSFRSFVAGLLLILPLILANFMAFSYMSVMNIGLSINTLPVAAVGVGIGVDFAIYLYSRIIEEFPHQDGWVNTILVAVRTSGTAVVYTGLTLILAIIPWYFLTDLKFQAQMGFFLSMLLLINVIFALTLHPLLICLIKPRFVSRGRMTPAGKAE
jgi:predicted RND superfamily exporter protein